MCLDILGFLVVVGGCFVHDIDSELIQLPKISIDVSGGWFGKVSSLYLFDWVSSYPDALIFFRGVAKNHQPDMF